MKITVLHGSPRKNRNSDTLTEQFLRGLKETNTHQITHYYINELNIAPCQGCLNCAKPPHNCRIDDDMQQIYRSYRDSELIVWASPMYWGYLTAQLKLVQDRMEALAWSGFGNKTFAVLFTYRHHYESAAGMFKRIAPHFNIDFHILPCQTYNPKTKKDIPIEQCINELEQAYQLGVTLGNQ